jgi:hypothetical protein
MLTNFYIFKKFDFISRKFFKNFEKMDLQNRNILERFIDMSTDDVKKHCLEHSLPYYNLALNVVSDLNMGNMMRTSSLCGCRKFIIYGRRKFDKRSSVGSFNYIDYEQIAGGKPLKSHLDPYDFVIDPIQFKEYIISNNLLPIFIELTPNSKKVDNQILDEIFIVAKKIEKIPTFIYGSEHYGVPQNILELEFPEVYYLKLNQAPPIQSFNVSNCLSIISYKIMELFTH